MDKLIDLKNQIDADLKRIPGAQQVEDQAGVPLIAIAGGAATVFIILALLILGPGFAVDFVGFAFPAYASLKALESDSKDDDTQWLTYWVVYAFFDVLETFVDLFEEWIPYYFFLKFFFLIWLFAPMTMGADVIYKNIVRPFLKKNEAEIDAFGNKFEGVIDEGINATSEIAENLKGVVEDTVKDIVADDQAHEEAMKEIHDEEAKEQAEAAAEEQAEEAAADQAAEQTEEAATEEFTPAGDDD